MNLLQPLYLFTQPGHHSGPISLAPTKALKVGASPSPHSPSRLLADEDRLIEEFVVAYGDAIYQGIQRAQEELGIGIALGVGAVNSSHDAAGSEDPSRTEDAAWLPEEDADPGRAADVARNDMAVEDRGAWRMHLWSARKRRGPRGGIDQVVVEDPGLTRVGDTMEIRVDRGGEPPSTQQLVRSLDVPGPWAAGDGDLGVAHSAMVPLEHPP